MYDIIIVDDSAEIRKGLMLKLNWQEYGFNVLTEASNGEKALALLKARRVPVLITDIRMPVMDGLELLQECAIRYPEMKTVVLSGYNDFPLVQTAIRKGAKDYLLKPVMKTELIAVLLKIKKELDDERERALVKIVHEDVLFPEVSALVTMYGMAEWANHAAPVRFVTSEMRIPQSRLAGGQVSGVSFKEAYQLLVMEVVSQWDKNVVVFRDPNQPYRMHFIVHQDSGSMNEDSDELLNRFIADVKEKVIRFLQIELVIGVSHPVCGVQHWKTGLESSLLSLSRSKPDMVSQTIFNDYHEHEEGLSNAILKRFALSIENANEGQMLQTLDEISQAGKQASVQSFSFFLVQLCLMMDELIRKYDLRDIDLHLMLWHYINSVWGYESFDKIIGNIRDISLRAVASLQRFKNKGREDTITVIQKHMLNHYGEELTLSAIAEQFHYNVAYLSDLFRKQTGSTFSDYLLKIRMDNACKLLQDNSLKIADIAELTGFSSSAYFSNVFKGCFGVGPNEYRKKMSTLES
ncbi:response regulator transcription factor [Cohnella silvisoli]|uniref:Response regulator n=1 Tax=Cohnella silvisoli TaxID=2873699 RepID=A0ABV1KLW3_9BACL|nr:response regulator [Cohnella silvisoli]MCD9020710.1 response regulator [Cohnella silvisoli]